MSSFTWTNLEFMEKVFSCLGGLGFGLAGLGGKNWLWIISNVGIVRFTLERIWFGRFLAELILISNVLVGSALLTLFKTLEHVPKLRILREFYYIL